MADKAMVSGGKICEEVLETSHALSIWSRHNFQDLNAVLVPVLLFLGLAV